MRIPAIAKTHLAPELLVSRRITVVTKCLLQESQQDRDNDASLQRFTETYKKDFDKVKSISIVFILKTAVSLLGTANTLTVMAKDCDGSMDSKSSESAMDRLLFHSDAFMACPGRICEQIVSRREKLR